MGLLLCAWLVNANADDLAQRAHRAEGALEYDEAARLWLAVLAIEDLPAHRRNNAHLQIAAAFVVLGDKEGARSHFRRVLSDDPIATLAPDAPAKVRVVFEDVRNELRATSKDKRDNSQWLAGTVALSVGVASGVTAGVLFTLAASADAEALLTPVQVQRAAVYNQRDGLVLAADTAVLGSLALFAIAAGVGALGSIDEAP